MGSKRKSADFLPLFSFDADTQEAVITPHAIPGAAAVDVPPTIEPEPPLVAAVPAGGTFVDVTDAPIGLTTDAAVPPEPPSLSPNTRTSVAVPDLPAPTVMAHGMGDAAHGQSFIGIEQTGTRRYDIGGARRLVVPSSEPAPTVMAGGIGSVNTGQYTLGSDGACEEQEDGKPPYRIPLMSEVRALPWNGLTVVSTFSGCGGSCLGYKMAGYRVLWANEFVPEAQNTYRANHPDTHLSTQDIRTVTAAQIRAVIGDTEIDVLEGSPPCASFSTAGKGSKGWGQVRKYSDTQQRTDDLFTEYIRLIEELKPRAFTAENVAGMVKGVAIGFFNEYLRAMQKLPYNVDARLLDAQWLGVPQRRVRLIFVGVRKDVGRPKFPRKLPYRYSVRDAIPWIARQGDNGGFGAGGMQDASAPSPTIGASDQAGNGRFPPSIVEVDPRVIYYEGFSGTPPRDVTDGPAPTVKVGGENAICSTHFIVEGAGAPDADTKVNRKVFLEGGNGFDKHAPKSVDDPAATIQAGRALNVLSEPRLVVGGSSPSGLRGTEVDLDGPAPTIVGANAGGKCQLFVESEGQPTDAPTPSLEGYAIGREWDAMKEGESTFYGGRLHKVDSGDVCPTVTQTGGQPGAAGVTHPFERRKFTIAELRRICGFPDDFILTGTYSQQWERMGRAVPPPMMRAVADALIPVLKK